MNLPVQPPTPHRHTLHRNVRVPGLAGLLNDIAGKMIYPLLLH